MNTTAGFLERCCDPRASTQPRDEKEECDSECGCTSVPNGQPDDTEKKRTTHEEAGDRKQEAEVLRLEDLVPIAFVIAGGCESCAERMVRRAVDQGSSERQVARTLRILEHLRKQDCVAEKIGEEVLTRMDAPLARARQTLNQAASS